MFYIYDPGRTNLGDVLGFNPKGTRALETPDRPALTVPIVYIRTTILSNMCRNVRT